MRKARETDGRGWQREGEEKTRGEGEGAELSTLN